MPKINDLSAPIPPPRLKRAVSLDGIMAGGRLQGIKNVSDAPSPRLMRTVDIDDIMGEVHLHDIKDVPNALPCQLANTPHEHEQTTGSHAITAAYNVMEAGRQTLSRTGRSSDVRALDRGIGHLLLDNSGKQSDKIHVYLTALGAVRSGIEYQLARSPNDKSLGGRLAQLDKAIVNVGIKMGECKGVPDGSSHGDKASKALFDAIEAGKDLMVECFHKIGGQKLFTGIAASILPPAMRDAIAVRLKEQLPRFTAATGASHLKEALERRTTLGLQSLLQTHLNRGGAEDLTNAVLHLLKVPEYVKMNDPGSKGVQPDPTDRSKAGDMPPWLSDRGAPIAYNHVDVHNDIAELLKHLPRPELPLTSVHSIDLDRLVEEMRRDAYSLGRAEERNQYLAEENLQLRREKAELKEQLARTVSRAEAWFNGAGQQREQRERVFFDMQTSTNEPERRNVGSGPERSVETDPDNPVPPRQPRGMNTGSGDGVLRADRETKVDQRNLFDRRNQLDKRNQFDQRNQNAPNSQNGEGAQHLRRNVDSQGNQKETRTLGNQSNQNEQADRRIHNASGNQLSPDGRLDDIAVPDVPRQRGRQLQGLDETDHSNSRLQRQQRLGGGQQRLQRQVQNNATGNAGQNDDGTPVVGELVHYLQSFGIEGKHQPRSSVQPMGPRNLSQHDVDGHSTGLSDTRTLLPSDFSGWRKDLADMTDAPFVPFRSGPVGRPSTRPLDEFEELIQRYGQGNVKPKHAMDRAGRSPALPTPMVIREPASELIQAFDAFRSRKMTQPTLSASPAPLSVPARPIHSAAESTRRVEARSRLDSLASVSSVSSRAGSLRDEIIIGSRSSRGELSRQAQFGDAVESLREVDSITIDSTPHGATSSVEPLRSDQSRAAASPSENARTSQLFTRSVSQMSLDSDDGIDADTFAQMIIKGSRVSRGEIARQQSDVELAASRVKQWELKEQFGPGWGQPASGAASSISSSESSLSDRLDEDFPVIEPDTDVVDTAEKWKRAASAESHDSGNESPTRLTESNGADATWDPQPIFGVGNRIAPGAAFMAELKQRTALQAAS